MLLFLVLVSQHPEKNTHLWVTVLKEQATDFLGKKGQGWGEVRHHGMLY